MAEKHEMRVLDGSGDTKTTWDPDNADEVSMAKEQFDGFIKKNFNAFTVNKIGKKGKKITDFDSSLGSLIMVPPIMAG